MAKSDIGCVKIIVIIACIIILLSAILLPLSFDYLDYDEYGFLRQKSTSKVYTESVYEGGRHLVGPDFEFKTYPAIARTVYLTGTSVFTKDTLEVRLNIYFQYFLRPQQLKYLHKKYQLTYQEVIRSTAMDAVKGAAVAFTTEVFIKNRKEVEMAMWTAVKERVGGICCENDCSASFCLSDCIPLRSCVNESDMGLMVDVRFFHLTKVEMPRKVYLRYLRALLLFEESQMERYKLEEAVVKKEVDEGVKMIINKAEETKQKSKAEAALITRRAQAESKRLVGQARSEGLKGLMTACGITQPQHKLSYHYLGALGSSEKVNLAVDFHNYVIGGR